MRKAFNNKEGLSIWKSYRNIVYKNCTTPLTTRESLTYWRNHLFAATVSYLIPLSLIALVPGVYLAYIEELIYLVYADLIAVLSLSFIAFAPRVNIYIRKLIFCIALYMVSIALIFYLGTVGPGLMYLLAITLFVVLIFEKKYGIGIVVINTLVCVFFGFAIYFQWWDNIIFSAYGLQSWIAVSSNLVFLSLLAVILLPKLFNGLQTTMEEQNRLKNELEKNQQQLKQSLQQLEEKNSELEDFAYSASHDMKEPLRMIRSFLTLLDERYSSNLDERGKKYIHFAVDGAKRMATFIDDLLEYSRVGRIYSSFEQVDVNEVLEDVKGTFTHKIQNNSAVISYSSMPVIHAVPVAIRMLFQNLIGNALKYQPKDAKAEIHISCEDSGSHWQFRVTDNGIGIKESDYDQIFQLFNRLHSNVEYSGSGMGLAICKKIVTQHGGTIWVESKEGEGSTFFFTIEKNHS